MEMFLGSFFDWRGPKKKKNSQKKMSKRAKKDQDDGTWKRPNCIVFCDVNNRKEDDVYAEKVRQALRELLRWQVKKGTPVYDNITEFSSYYSVRQRNPTEVATIFAMAEGIISMPTAQNSKAQDSKDASSSTETHPENSEEDA